MCRILFTLLDESEEIQQLAKFYIEQRLLKLLPRIMQSCFLEVSQHSDPPFHLPSDPKKQPSKSGSGFDEKKAPFGFRQNRLGSFGSFTLP